MTEVLPSRNTTLPSEEPDAETAVAWNESLCFHPQPSRGVFAVVVLDLGLAVLTVLGNVCVVYAVLRYRQLRTVTNVFVVGLAAADLLVGLNVPYYVLFYFDLKAVSCRRMPCLLRYWLSTYASGCSMLCMVGVAVDRYIAILHPLSYHRVVRTHSASWYLLLVWLTMGVVSSLPLVGIGGRRFDPSQECDLYYTHTKAFALGAVSALVLATFLITTALYAVIFKAAWRQKRAVVDFGHKVRQEARTARMMALVMGVNFLGFLPYLALVSLRYLDGVNQDRVSALKPFAVFCYFGKSALNPVIYGWKNKDFRSAFSRIASLRRRR